MKAYSKTKARWSPIICGVTPAFRIPGKSILPEVLGCVVVENNRVCVSEKGGGDGGGMSNGKKINQPHTHTHTQLSAPRTGHLDGDELLLPPAVVHGVGVGALDRLPLRVRPRQHLVCFGVVDWCWS